MKRNRKRIIAAVAVIAPLPPAGRPLPTASSVTPSPTARPLATARLPSPAPRSPTSTTRSSANGTNITAVNFTFTGNLEGDTLQLAFDNANLAQCSHTGITAGVIPTGAYDGTTSTTVTCDVTEGTTAATSLQATVTNN